MINASLFFSSSGNKKDFADVLHGYRSIFQANMPPSYPIALMSKNNKLWPISPNT